MTIAAKQRCKDAFEVWRERFLRDGQASPILRERTELTDSIVLEAHASTLARVFPEGCTLLAVGGYGRRELFPCSDVDLLILVRRPLEGASARDTLGEFLRLLWDSGLRASHSVRTVDECCSVQEGNFELTVSLLDQRLLAGDEELYRALRERSARFLAAERADLTRRLCRLARSRHAHFHNTIYRLEPDIKETPGGLRDLHTIHWLRALRQAPEDAGTAYGEGLLAAVRCFLHFRAGRDNNLLSFEAQDEISAAAFSEWRDPAQWMGAWYGSASRIHSDTLLELEAAESRGRGLLDGFRDWRSRLSNSDFTVSRDSVMLRNPHALASDPDLALRLFRFCAHHGMPLARQTEQRIADNLDALSRHFAGHPPRSAYWRDLLSQPHAHQALRAMRSTGFLPLLIPEWARIEHLVVRDFYHQYTVDEHTSVALDTLAALARAKEQPESRFAGLLEECGGMLWLLRMAILFHDIGKGSGTDHTREAERLAANFLERIGVPELESEMVRHLISKHLLLSGALQTRDLADPATAAILADEVHTVESLRLLTLLTFADIGAVNSAALTPWRMEQLWRLYRIVHRQLTGELSAVPLQTPGDAFGELTAGMAGFLEGLPDRYLWTHTRSQAAAHAALFEQACFTGAALEIERRDGAWHLVAIAADRPFLFASIAGALSSFGLEILKAEAFSNARHYIADTFVFTDPSRSLDLNAPEVDRLRSVLRKVILGQTRVEDLLRNRPVKAPPGRVSAIRPSVSFDNEASPSATVFEVVTIDRPGLLYSLSSVISRAGANIDVVLVDTEAHKALDVFHVTSGGAKLPHEAAEALRSALLAACG